MTIKDKMTGKMYHNVQSIRSATSGAGRGDWIIFVADERKFPKNWNKDPYPVERFEEIPDE